jgi:hypothetical protein
MKANDLMTLIPAFKPEFLDKTLSSVHSQSIRPSCVLISDDSQNSIFVKLHNANHYKTCFPNLNIQVIEGPKTGAPSNLLNLIRHAKGKAKYFHFLFDDDVIFPEFYNEHLRVLQAAVANCTISRRWIIDEMGAVINSTSSPFVPNSSKYLKLEAKLLFETIIPNINNWLGEFSNAVMDDEALKLLEDGRLDGIPYIGLWDVGLFLQTAEEKNLILIDNYLSGFRQSSASITSSKTSNLFKLAILAWLPLASYGYSKKYISKDQFLNCLNHICRILENLFPDSSDLNILKRILHDIHISEENNNNLLEEFWIDSLGKISEYKNYVRYKGDEK